MEPLIINRLNFIIGDINDAARNIYYAMHYIPETNHARANLNSALEALGVTNPKQVGLSDSAGKYRENDDILDPRD